MATPEHQTARRIVVLDRETLRDDIVLKAKRIGELPDYQALIPRCRAHAYWGLPDGTTSFLTLQGHGDAPAELVYSRSICCISTRDLTRLPQLEKAGLEALLGGAG